MENDWFTQNPEQICEAIRKALKGCFGNSAHVESAINSAVRTFLGKRDNYRLESEKNVENLLFIIAKRKLQKKAYGRPRQQPLAPAELPSQAPPDPIWVQECQQAIDEAMALLSEQQRQMVALRLDAYTYVEIARNMDTTTQDVQYQFKKIFKTFREVAGEEAPLIREALGTRVLNVDADTPKTSEE